MTDVKNLKQLKEKLKTDSAFAQEFQENPIGTLDTLDPTKHLNLFRIVLYFVGFALVFSLVMAAIIIMSEPVTLTNVDGQKYSQFRTVDQFFVMIGSAAIGALSGLLVPRSDE